MLQGGDLTDEDGEWILAFGKSEFVYVCKGRTEVDVVVFPSGHVAVQPASWEDQAMVLSPAPF